MGSPRAKAPKVRAALALAAAGLAGLPASCGTLLYPERVGQPPGLLDPGVVLLDGVGLLLFLVPGVVAFAVDFSTGAIYLPQGCPCWVPLAAADLQRVEAGPGGLTREAVEAAVARRTGRAVRLRPGEYRAARLRDLGDFTPEAVARAQAGPAAQVVFRACGEPPETTRQRDPH